MAEEEKTTPTDTPTNDEIADVERQMRRPLQLRTTTKLVQFKLYVCHLLCVSSIFESL